jgi:rod shape-determining protein MreC
MAVITQDGIVGKLRDVFPTTSEVLEINDQSSGAGVVLASTRIRAILRGTLTGRVQIVNLTADSRIQPGEQVLTSGGDQVYPRGLPVGVVESIAPDPDHQPYSAIRVHPAVDLDRVAEVLVITGTQSDLSQAAQQDMAAAEAQHAADLSAQQLPGIHDDANPAAASGAPPAANASPVTSHPLPVLHPDRFSSGSTPPASAMTPGAASSAESIQSAPSSTQARPPQAKPQPGATK